MALETKGPELENGWHNISLNNHSSFWDYVRGLQEPTRGGLKYE
jgi:hypothetical protein